MERSGESVGLEERLHRLESEIEQLKIRNQRVEADKAWETSMFRKITICVITYFAAAALLFLIGSTKFWLDALIPTGAYLLSVQTVPVLKRWWIAQRMKDP